MCRSTGGEVMDIVESLRRDAKVTQNAQYRRAADEIERLTAELAEEREKYRVLRLLIDEYLIYDIGEAKNVIDRAINGLSARVRELGR